MMDGWMDGWMKGRRDGRTNGWISTSMDVSSVQMFRSDVPRMHG